MLCLEVKEVPEIRGTILSSDRLPGCSIHGLPLHRSPAVSRFGPPSRPDRPNTTPKVFSLLSRELPAVRVGVHLKPRKPYQDRHQQVHHLRRQKPSAIGDLWVSGRSDPLLYLDDWMLWAGASNDTRRSWLVWHEKVHDANDTRRSWVGQEVLQKLELRSIRVSETALVLLMYLIALLVMLMM